MASLKKYPIIGIFISILTIFAMSHNAAAMRVVFDVSNYDTINSISTVYSHCDFINGTNITGTHVVNCSATINNTTSLQNIYSEQTFSVKKNDLLNFYLIIVSTSESFQFEPRFVDFSATNGGWDIIDYTEISNTQYNHDLLSYNGHLNQQGSNYDLNLDYYEANGFYKIYDITLRARNDGDLNFGLWSAGGLYRFNSNDLGQTFMVSLRNFRHLRRGESQENKEVEEKTQSAVDDSEDAGSSSSSSAQQGGANLLSAITGFFNVITSAQPSNCRFNAPLNTYFGNERLNVDLCALDLPSGIGALTSIIAIGILIPFAIHMFNKFIALFRSFQS